MATYLNYPKAKDTPNRKVRKSERRRVWEVNRKANRVQKGK